MKITPGELATLGEVIAHLQWYMAAVDQNIANELWKEYVDNS